MIKRRLYLAAGFVATGIGIVGVFLPGLPGVLFLILAAACFARSNPELEARLLAHPKYGPIITDWRERGVVSRKAKWSASIVFVLTIVASPIFFPLPWSAIPPVACTIVGTWLWLRPEK